MEFVIDLSGVPIDSPISFGWWLIKTVGWMYPLFLFSYGLILAWQQYIRNQYRKKRNYILLAIDIPKNNEQTPKAMENFFSMLAGAHQKLNWHHKWWFGEIKDSFSFELISIGGYIQFVIHLRDTYRDLIEAGIYAQYPDASITEIEDYAHRWHHLKFPNDQYDLHAADIVLARHDIYPLVTHQSFEDSVSGEIKDPMAGTLEALSRIGPGEEMYLQILVTPADNDWGEHHGQHTIDKLVGNAHHHKSTIFTTVLEYVFMVPNMILEAFSPPGEGHSEHKEKEGNDMQYLTPGQKDTVAAIEDKIGKIGFYTRIIYLYIAEKDKFNKVKAGQGLYGSLKQYNSLGLNSLKPHKKKFTGGVVYFKQSRLNERKRKLLHHYISRGQPLEPGFYGEVLNTVELATLWHFPVMTVKTPLVKKSESKKSEPPMSLPIAETPTVIKPVGERVSAEPPSNLPI